MAEISIKSAEKDNEKLNFVEKCEQQNKIKTITIEFEEKSCESKRPQEKAKFQIETVAFVATKLKEFFKKKGWFATPTLNKIGGNLKTTIENRCSMRDLVEDFRFFLRQYFSENCQEVMPRYFYSTQTTLSQIASTLGFRVVKPQNKFILQYHSF
jgi:hypothetical protein